MKRRVDRARGVVPDPDLATSSFGEVLGTLQSVKASKRLRQSSKPLMNQLEAEYFNVLKLKFGERDIIIPQSVRIKLGNGIWYKPDFYFYPRHFIEVKGPHSFRGGFENLKVAASKYPQFTFWLVWKDKELGWQTQEIFA